MKSKVIFFVIWSILAVPSWAKDLSGKDGSSSGIPFELDKFGLILIRGQVNGHPATLLVDTGSSHTAMSPDVMEAHPMQLEYARPAAKGSGFVGSARWGTATVEVGPLKWMTQKVLVMDSLRELSKSVGKKVDGILGQDMLQLAGSVVIDFKHRRIILR